jgi:hypothetical protein
VPQEKEPPPQPEDEFALHRGASEGREQGELLAFAAPQEAKEESSRTTGSPHLGQVS